MKNIKDFLQFLREYLFLILAILLAISFPFSESLLSISAGFIFLQLFLPERWDYKLVVIKLDTALWALMGVYLIHVIGIFFCRDWETGIYELKKNLFWLFIPLGVSTYKKLTSNVFWYILVLFVSSVTIATFIVALRIVFQDYLQIIDVRDASFVSHVAFSYQIIFSFFLISYSLIRNAGVFSKIPPYLRGIWLFWLLFFLMFQKSLLAILSLYFASIYFMFWISKTVKSKSIHRVAIVSTFVVLILPIIYVSNVYFDFHKELDIVPTEKIVYTQQGNSYSFDYNNKQKENGHYVSWYICGGELEEAWNKRSVIKLFEKGATDYPIYYTLIRYLTSKGLKKDEQGVNLLSDKDICNIQKGMSNYIYAERKYLLYPRIYETIWEIDEYERTGNPNNQSLSQRIEYVKAAFYIIKNNFWGVGTGNYKLEFADAFQQIDTKLDSDLRFYVHNQYLSYMVKFGILGLVTILFLIFHAIYSKRQFKNVLLLVLLIIIIVSNFGEAILETHIGLLFFVFFLSLFIWHSPEELSR